MYFVVDSFSSQYFRFLLRIFDETLQYEAYHCGVSCFITSLSKNKIQSISKWSVFNEAMRFLDNMPVSRKKNIIMEHLNAMKVPTVGERLYSSYCIVRAFEYFTVSRSLYSRLREDYQLPSISTLTKLTSRANKLDETALISKIFSNLEERQRMCILMVDEVYVKASGVSLLCI